MHTIKIPFGIEGDASADHFEAFCKEFGCTAVRVTREAVWFISSDDAVNFFWLGANINFKHDSALSVSASSKTLG